MTTDAAPWFEQIRAAIDEARSGPTPEDLATAPTLSPWHPILTLAAEPLLWGHVNGHPILGARWITTARLIALDPDGQWARTFSRWYRLSRGIGQPAAGPEAPECRQPACGDKARLAADAGRLGCLPVSNRALLDRLLASHRDQLRGARMQTAGVRRQGPAGGRRWTPGMSSRQQSRPARSSARVPQGPAARAPGHDRRRAGGETLSR
ncbi:DUF6634 family protein [Paracoccus actinidiae]|uniref:DUF6634 family protein n=1 Tax=Paracoccus actinidiae TaxID=3064531 RepID=UPI0027D26262|nr:DUF6634 family protein [Paracoccus sp. M09]